MPVRVHHLPVHDLPVHHLGCLDAAADLADLEPLDAGLCLADLRPARGAPGPDRIRLDSAYLSTPVAEAFDAVVHVPESTLDADLGF